ncbi:MAG: aminotransferase class I/II-fold pyridoxal phosphate-dependent enzyme, partial [Shimia sp.]
CPPHASQVAALGALGAHDELQGHLATYAENRRLLLDGLPRIGLPVISPADGAFYAYVDVSGLGRDSLSLSRAILDEVGVAVTPGLDFDAARGGGTLRLSYARSTADISEGLERLGAFMARG